VRRRRSGVMRSRRLRIAMIDFPVPSRLNSRAPRWRDSVRGRGVSA
jgi:hypothetical protein